MLKIWRRLVAALLRRNRRGVAIHGERGAGKHGGRGGRAYVRGSRSGKAIGGRGGDSV